MNIAKKIDNGTTDIEKENLASLYKITKTLVSSNSIQESLMDIVKILRQEKSMENGTITIVNPQTGELEIETACGITAEARKRGRYKLGEGITGRVVSAGDPIIVPQDRARANVS